MVLARKMHFASAVWNSHELIKLKLIPGWWWGITPEWRNGRAL